MLWIPADDRLLEARTCGRHRRGRQLPFVDSVDGPLIGLVGRQFRPADLIALEDGKIAPDCSERGFKRFPKSGQLRRVYRAGAEPLLSLPLDGRRGGRENVRMACNRASTAAKSLPGARACRPRSSAGWLVTSARGAAKAVMSNDSRRKVSSPSTNRSSSEASALSSVTIPPSPLSGVCASNMASKGKFTVSRPPNPHDV